MRTPPVLLIALLLTLVIAHPFAAPAQAQDCSFPVNMNDATGTEVTIPEEPSRVVTLSPSAAQTMWEIQARAKVVGVTKYADYLEGANSRTQISTTEQMVSIETVVNLTPDLVLAPNVVPTDTVKKLRDAGVTVYYFPPAKSIDDVYRKTRRIGRLTGKCTEGTTTVQWMKDRVSIAKSAAESQEQPDVLYLFFGHTAGKETFINEIIKTAGGNNIAVDANVSGYQQLNEEIVLRENPDWIIRNSENPLGVRTDVLNQTTALEKNQTITVQIEHLNQPAPRIVHAITKLAKAFYPEAYTIANTTQTPTNTPRSTTIDTTTRPTAPSQTPSQDGFGIITVLCATVIYWRYR